MAGAALAVKVAVDVAVMLLLATKVMVPPAVFGVAVAACAVWAVWICAGVCAVKVMLASGALGTDGVLLLAMLMTVVVPLLAA